MAKQRRNRERATELITVLDGMVPAKYPYRAFSLPASGAELSLQKRSRNMTLEDVIDAVRAAVGKDSEKSKKRNRASEGKVSIRDVMNASREIFAVAVLQEDGERAFIGCGGWNVDEITGVGTCETSNTACNSIAIRAEDLAVQLAARENMSETMSSMGSIGHSSQGMYPDSRMGMGNMMRGGMPGMMPHMSQSLPQKPAMGSSSLQAAEKAFLDALRRLEYERSQEAARSECGSISYQADQLGSLQGARSQCGSVRFSLDTLEQQKPASVNMVNPMLAQQQQVQMQQGYAPSPVQQLPASMVGCEPLAGRTAELVQQGMQGGGMMGNYNMGGYPMPDMQQEQQYMGNGMGAGSSASPMGPPMGLPSRMQAGGAGMMAGGGMGPDASGPDMQGGQYGSMSHGGRNEMQNDFGGQMQGGMPPPGNGDEWSRLEVDEFRPQYMGGSNMGMMEMPPPEFEVKPQINRTPDDMNQFMVPNQKMPQQ
ncbi:hypothetical protein GUITHDRAFT_146046, partial [Guillardia theta CCMP2712]